MLQISVSKDKIIQKHKISLETQARCSCIKLNMKNANSFNRDVCYAQGSGGNRELIMKKDTEGQTRIAN